MNVGVSVETAEPVQDVFTLLTNKLAHAKSKMLATLHRHQVLSDALVTATSFRTLDSSALEGAARRRLTLEEICVDVQAELKRADEEHSRLEANIDKLIGIVATKSEPPIKGKVMRLLSAVSLYVKGDLANAGITPEDLHTVECIGKQMDAYQQSTTSPPPPAPPTITPRFSPAVNADRVTLAAALGVVPQLEGYTAEELGPHVVRLKTQVDQATVTQRSNESSINFLREKLLKDQSVYERGTIEAIERLNEKQGDLNVKIMEYNEEHNLRTLFTDRITATRPMVPGWPSTITHVGEDVAAMANRGLDHRAPPTVSLDELSSQTVIFTTSSAERRRVIEPALDMLILVDADDLVWVTDTVLRDLDCRIVKGVNQAYFESEWHYLCMACDRLVQRMVAYLTNHGHYAIFSGKLLLTIARFFEFFVRADLAWCQQSDGYFAVWLQTVTNIIEHSKRSLDHLVTLILNWVNVAIRGLFKQSLATLLQSMHLPTVTCNGNADLVLFVFGVDADVDSGLSIASLSKETDELCVWSLSECEPDMSSDSLIIEPITERWTRYGPRGLQSELRDPLLISPDNSSNSVCKALKKFWPRKVRTWELPVRLPNFHVGLDQRAEKGPLAFLWDDHVDQHDVVHENDDEEGNEGDDID